MPSVFVDRQKIDILANAIADKSGESVPMTLAEMVEAVDGIETGSGTIVVGGITQDQNGYLVLDDDAPPGTPTLISKTITQNGTYDAEDDDADGYSSVTVNVQSSGDSPYTLLDSSEVSASTTSSSAVSVGTIVLGNSLYTANAIIYVKVRDKAGKRNGYFYGTDTFFVNAYAGKGTSQSLVAIRPTILYSFDANGIIKFNPSSSGYVFASSSSCYGVYAANITGAGDITVQAKYNTAAGTIDGTYTVDTYLLKWPDNSSPISMVGE